MYLNFHPQYRIWFKTDKGMFSDDWDNVKSLSELIKKAEKTLKYHPKWFGCFGFDEILSCHIKVIDRIFIKIK